MTIPKERLKRLRRSSFQLKQMNVGMILIQIQMKILKKKSQKTFGSLNLERMLLVDTELVFATLWQKSKTQ
jgi:hypothetical protein